jgi:hypothetical protein
MVKSIYWKVEIIDDFNINMLIPLNKLVEMQKNMNLKIKILIDDVELYLLLKSWKKVESRVIYYQEIIISILEIINCDLKNIEFIRTSDFQLKLEYTLEVYIILSKLAININNLINNKEEKLNKNIQGISIIMDLISNIYIKSEYRLVSENNKYLYNILNDYIKPLEYDIEEYLYYKDLDIKYNLFEDLDIKHENNKIMEIYKLILMPYNNKLKIDNNNLIYNINIIKNNLEQIKNKIKNNIKVQNFNEIREITFKN